LIGSGAKVRPRERRLPLSVLLLSGLAALCVYIGCFESVEGYHERDILQKCIAGLTCPNTHDQLQLQVRLVATRAQLDFGLALTVVGALVLSYMLYLILKGERNLEY